ncbi:hypothetical protein CKAN_02020900 [Cinnamomum micranthum f. kanehirae]|uniref:Uncharacterized protein n=1 Tax=Cinnamomum micranthum f. kanehirae TaxID=337451 RepID=A0A443PJX7_9MAGN|nr:hypothetical protein CKAN_02020900 [Cinnamomum micranthum f. kanehirae]
MEKRKEEGGDDSDGWVEDALQTDFMVANMLMRLSGQGRPPQKWLRRLPRTIQLHPSNGATRVKELEESARASPTTPLSFSGSSHSACDDPGRPAKRSRLDDSSQSDKPPTRAATAATDTRLKIVPPKTAKGLKTNPRKKKTVSELKQEENSLLMDKAKLTKELEALQAIRKDLRLKNERLKKQKLNLDSQLAVKSSGKTNSNHQQPVPPVKTANAASNPPPRVVFEIPDLNSVPPEEES